MHTSEKDLMSISEQEHEEITVELIAPNGLGFGEGGISVKKQIELGILTEEVPGHVHELLANDTEAFKPVDFDDDGCGDGRPWAKVMRLTPDGEVKFYGESRLRAKVFGGGLVAAASMWRTLKGAPEDGQTVGQDRAFIASKLSEQGLSHGAHTDNHAEGENCGCGAIDKYPLITANAVKYRGEIRATLQALYGETFDDNKEAIEKAFAVYEQLAGTEAYFADASGKHSMEQILNSGAVVKELAGHHVEETIVINDVPGTTLDQQYFTEIVKNASVNKPRIVQAFSVDIWRGKEIASTVTTIAKNENSNIDTEATYKLVYADFLIRTLAVAATLTAGDLPVYRRRSAQRTGAQSRATPSQHGHTTPEY